MHRYRLQVQVIQRYQLSLPADSEEDAIMAAEALSPRQIIARGRPAGAATGLADPASVELID
jgi:hypothetical protein